MAVLNNNTNVVAVNGGSKKREWALTTSGGGSTVTYAASASGSSWGQKLESSAVLTAGSRVQLRVVHAGTAVSVFVRDPAVVDLELGSDAGWTLVAQDAGFAVAVGDITDQPKAPMDLFTRVNNSSAGMPYKLFELEYRVDGVVAAHLVGGDVVLDPVANTLLDETGNVWGWGGDTDPIVTPNTAG
jgi:hypothetical protein